MIRIIKHYNRDKEKIKWLLQKVEESGGITYAMEKMKSYTTEALNILHQIPESPARKGLEELVRFVTDRKY